MIAVDAIYSPVRRVRYSVENTRVGQVTDLDRLLLEVETDGSITPQDAVTQAAEILVNHFAVVAGQSTPAVANAASPEAVTESNATKIMIEEVNFSPRTTNALLNNDIRTMKDLLRLSDAELRELKGFGAKAYEEVKDKIAELGLARETEEV
jgi:DNA-directed RNA polymerase subunit alpha